MSRSAKKGPYCAPKLLAKFENAAAGARLDITTWSRRSQIFPVMIGHMLRVHNGRIHIPVVITEDMVGHRLGEFAPTRKFVKHGGKLAAAQSQGKPNA